MKTINTPVVTKEISKCVRIAAGKVHLLGDLQIPEESSALVIFACGSGRSRNNPRNRHAARVLREHGIGTLLCELLTEEEEIDDEATCKFRCNANLLARRLVQVTEWVTEQPELGNLAIGYFGACAGGAAAVIAAVKSGTAKAVVTRGGRMDLATKALEKLKCPILMIVGDKDTVGIELNREAMARLKCKKQLVELEGATHLFGEPEKLAQMAELAATWFCQHLASPRIRNGHSK